MSSLPVLSGGPSELKAGTADMIIEELMVNNFITRNARLNEPFGQG